MTDNLDPKTNTSTQFAPMEKSRQVVENSTMGPIKLASEIGFNPVATMNVGDKKIYIRPVKNTTNRTVSPEVVGPTGKVAVGGERVISLSQYLHAEVKNKVNKAVNNLVPPKELSPATQKYTRPEDLSSSHVNKPSDTTTQNSVQTQPIAPVSPPIAQNTLPKSTQAVTPSHSEQLKSQLDEINKVLFAQIKQKIAVEIARQGKTATPTVTSTIETEKQTPPVATQNPSVVAKPSLALAENHVQAEVAPKAKLERPSLKVQIPSHWEQPKTVVLEPKQKPLQPKNPEPDKVAYKTQITRLEDEIKILTKEVDNLDKTVQALEQEKSNTQLATLERRIEVDQKMLAAVAEWRMALNNLINSHSIAIKYLKEKTDLLEQQTGHQAKHDQLHKPKTTPLKPPDTALLQKPLATTPLGVEAKPELSQPEKIEPKEVQTTSFEAVRDLVKQTMEKEKQAAEKTLPTQPDNTAVREMVKDALKEELPKPVQATPGKAQPSIIYVKEQPPINSSAPVINISTADIEKQILEQAEKEDAVKEALRKAKEQAELKIKAEREKKDQAVSDAAKNAPATQVKLVEASEDLIKSEVDKLKASLTTIDNSKLTNLSKDQRTDMIRQLENLEKQTLISKQFDEIKATAERRRINAELSGMLHQLGEKPPEQLLPTQNTEQKMQTLKVEEKKQTSPAQKAHLIAEIKELERQAQARKAVERSRPTVKAQPAFGKMLPNTPTTPNVINGIVKDNKGLLLSTVVLIVKDDKGEPVRAFKTNKIGQFALSTPVPNGVYTLELEKEGYDFDIIEVDVNGAIMQPIEIKAK